MLRILLFSCFFVASAFGQPGDNEPDDDEKILEYAQILFLPVGTDHGPQSLSPSLRAELLSTPLLKDLVSRYHRSLRQMRAPERLLTRGEQRTLKRRYENHLIEIALRNER